MRFVHHNQEDSHVATKTKQPAAQPAAKPAPQPRKPRAVQAPKAPLAPPKAPKPQVYPGGFQPASSPYASRQSTRVVRQAVIDVTLPDGTKQKVRPGRGSAKGVQDVIIHKDSWMVHGVQAYTPLTSVTIPALLGAVAATGNLTLACEELNMSRLSVYAFKKENASFCAALNEALLLGVEAWKDEAARRAFKGWDRPIFQQGLQVGAERQFSDTLALALLKAADPEHFQERGRVELGPMGSNPGQGLFAGKTEEEINEALTNRINMLGLIATSTKKTGTDV